MSVNVIRDLFADLDEGAPDPAEKLAAAIDKLCEVLRVRVEPEPSPEPDPEPMDISPPGEPEPEPLQFSPPSPEPPTWRLRIIRNGVKLIDSIVAEAGARRIVFTVIRGKDQQAESIIQKEV